MSLRNKYDLFWVFLLFLCLSNLMPKSFCKKVMWQSSFMKMSHNQRYLCRVVALITFAWIGHVTWSSGPLAFWYVLPSSLLVVIFLKVALRSFLLLLDHVITSSDMQEWQCFTQIWISTKVDDCSFHESCAMTSSIYHVITWSNLMPSVGWVLLHRSHKIWFICRIIFEHLTW